MKRARRTEVRPEASSHPRFPPTTREELERAGWDRADVVLVCGDAYVDHPAFGAAVIARRLEAAGFRVGVIPQPDWRSAKPFKALGRPRLFFGITGGNVDSMVANYTPFRNRRKRDDYSPGGKPGRRPNRAPIVYAQRVREAHPDVPVLLGGVEAGMRRLSHYDFWEDRIRRSMLLDAKADLLLYGMAEEAAVELARALAAGKRIEEVRRLPGSVYAANEDEVDPEIPRLPDFDRLAADPRAFTESFRLRHAAADPFKRQAVAEPYGPRLVVQNPPPLPLPPERLDAVYALPFTRRAHPRYRGQEIPALRTVEQSITTHRGCFGDCSFCGIAFHQGRLIQGRSMESILEEAKRLARDDRFRGTINDVGGPTANMFGYACRKAAAGDPCRRPHCLFPKPCPQLADGHGESVRLLRAVRSLPGVKHVFIQSGIRHDLALSKEGLPYLDEVVRHHVSGTLKVAPEHSEASVLEAMRKPPFETYEAFRRTFDRLNREAGRRQFLVSYFISAHPGCGMAEMRALRAKLDRLGLKPEQIQDYTPLPGTAASVMFHTGLDPFTDEPVHVERTDRERRAQRRVIQ
jgi:uncharacterized radical SAM protein YgiQ